MSKSAEEGKTLILRVGGLGSELFDASSTVSETTYSPGVLNVTLPGFCLFEVKGLPVGKTQEYFDAVVLVPNETELPAVIVTSPDGELMVPDGGVAVTLASSTQDATDGTPDASSKKSM